MPLKKIVQKVLLLLFKNGKKLLVILKYTSNNLSMNKEKNCGIVRVNQYSYNEFKYVSL